MTALNYVLRDTARLLVRHWFLSILTLITAAAMMWILGLTTLFALNVKNLLQRLESDLLVQAYIHRDGKEQELLSSVREMENVSAVRLLSPDDALAKLQGRMGSQSHVLDLIGENPLPWSLEIRVKTASEVPHLVRTLMAMPEIEDVVYSGMVVERVGAISRVASRAAASMFFLSIMITSLVVYNTIHISLYSRREEIGIMFLIGATRTYIAAPFVLEGTFLAFVGSIISMLGIVSSYFPGIRLLQNSLPFLHFVGDADVIRNFSLLLVGFGATLGWVCSCIVVTRFMSAAAKPL
jgi:cell division transport system permease protein